MELHEKHAGRIKNVCVLVILINVFLIADKHSTLGLCLSVPAAIVMVYVYFNEKKRCNMCGPSAYNSYLEYAAVFPEIAEILNTAGVKAKVKNAKDGISVKVDFNEHEADLNDGEGVRDTWSLNIGSTIIDLNLPVENRDAKAITSALLKAMGK